MYLDQKLPKIWENATTVSKKYTVVDRKCGPTQFLEQSVSLLRLIGEGNIYLESAKFSIPCGIVYYVLEIHFRIIR